MNAIGSVALLVEVQLGVVGEDDQINLLIKRNLIRLVVGHPVVLVMLDAVEDVESNLSELVADHRASNRVDLLRFRVLGLSIESSDVRSCVDLKNKKMSFAKKEGKRKKRNWPKIVFVKFF